MKNIVKEIFNMLNVLIRWAIDNKTKLESQPKVNEVINLIKEEHIQLDLNIGIQQKDLQSITIGKQIRRDNLIQQLYACNTVLYNEALRIGDLEGASKLKISLSQIKKLNQTALSKMALDRLEICKSKGDQLTETGITPERFENFQQSIKDFIDYKTKPIEMRNRRKMATLIMDQSSRKISWLITNRLTPLMKTFFADDPAFLEEYINAGSINKVPTRKLAVQGSIRNAETKEAVINSWLEVKGTDIAYRTTGNKGYFRIQSLEPGNYKIICTHGSYQPIAMEFTHIWGETTKLDLNLQMTEKAKREKETQKKKEKEVALALSSVN